MKALALVLLCAVQSVAAQSASDDIFNSGLESGIVFQGTAGYPGPLANATVELHLGSYVATTATKADGTYSLLVESRYFTSVTIAELFAFGHGADVAMVWASPLGPSDRLQHWAPWHRHRRGTILTSIRARRHLRALRAYNGFVPITDKATFWPAQSGLYDDLTSRWPWWRAAIKHCRPHSNTLLRCFMANSAALCGRRIRQCKLLVHAHCAVLRGVCHAADGSGDRAGVSWNDDRTHIFGEFAFTSTPTSGDEIMANCPHASTADFRRSTALS